ncbi:WD-40 repeat-containing protein [Panus rudis PR-1116 ss-1]|nr:WD-40 repeat-containing protein [Panus rudis PR-1116 ss-1]
MSTAAPSSPLHLLRTHLANPNALWISEDNERVYSGDASGSVVVTSTRTIRSIASWKAHTDGILGVQEWGDYILTHGRDNKLHVWSRKTIQDPSTRRLRDTAVQPGLPTPELCYSMDVNALNFCRFSLMPLVGEGCSEDTQALIALPNLVESSLADIWTLPSQKRLHAAIGKANIEDPTASLIDGRGPNSLGIIMSLHLFYHPHPSLPGRSQLRLLCAYESGKVILYACTRTDKTTSVEGVGWDVVWTAKLHVESVMSMAVSRDNSLAFTVSADHLIGKYDLILAETLDNRDQAFTVHRTKHPGNASMSIRDDGRVCAIGGWDGKIRLYSTKSFKPLGTLDYHKKSIQSLTFAHSLSPFQNKLEDDKAQEADEQEADWDGYDDEEDYSEKEKEERSRWLIAGSQDTRISVWQLISFERRP